MTKEEFRKIINSARVQVIGPYGDQPEGLFVTGVTQRELAQIATIAGIALGEFPENAALNPSWFTIGPKVGLAFMGCPNQPIP